MHSAAESLGVAPAIEIPGIAKDLADAAGTKRFIHDSSGNIRL